MYYTYAYLREDGTPYYIGKGKGDRAYSKRINEIKPPKDKNRILILKQNLIEEYAFKHERYMINVYGRKDLGTGILYNRTDGGEGASGAIRTEKHKKMISESKKGKCRSEEIKRKISDTKKGKKCSEETKLKIGEAMEGKTHSEETKRKISESRKGMHFSEETKQKMREKALLREELKRNNK